MIKARFMKEQPPVSVSLYDGKTYVFICLNGIWKTEEASDNTQEPESYIEYDYNEFSFYEGEADVDDIMVNPQKYLNYPLPAVSDIEQLRADVDYLLMISE